MQGRSGPKRLWIQWISAEVEAGRLAPGIAWYNHDSMDLYRMIWDLAPAPASTQLTRLESIERLYNRHKEADYALYEDSYGWFPEDDEQLNDLAEKLQVIQAHAQYLSILETMQIELLEALTSDIRCNENGQFEVTLDKWIAATRDALSASPM